MSQRETWGSRTGFILAAVGSAIGLGNIWRFPYMAYENGGGAFLIPYIFAMLTAGIPFMIMEFGLGHRYRGAAPKIFASLNRRWEWLGWTQVLVAFAIATYYVTVVGWSISYFVMSFTQAWGPDTKSFFFGEYLQLGGSPIKLGSIVWPIFFANTAAWAVVALAIFRGVRKGIEKLNKIFMPVLFLLVLVFIARIAFLPGATDGFNWLYKPDFSALTNYKVWADAYGQIFYTLSIGFAIMLSYSSYLPKKSDINNNACMTVFINCGFSMLAGLMIFGVLGYMAAQQGVAIDQVVSSGVGLAFITLPAAINLLPMPYVLGPLFFLCLVLAGLSSMISIVEAVVSAIIGKFGWSRTAAAALVCGLGFLASVMYTMNGGLFLLDIVDHFVNNFGIIGCCLIEIILVGWFCNLEVLRKHINATSEFNVGDIWKVALRIVTPIVLGYITLSNLIGDLSNNYGDYSTLALGVCGWLVLFGMVILGVGLQFEKGVHTYALVNDEFTKRK
ncbi:sodium-dependent transporter [Pseudodesulfovibrio tunisiensis]|uniref:sodium-dependent transporter n=1 Tax=Pseudodesulfovibrio tunisiensis TaxID=463192 RepID=UPI001FB40DEA|nr:sodium-dependent transporter [Pseudodesulfovibrio tunisiensis]